MVESVLAEVRGQVAESSKHIEHAREVLEDRCGDLQDQSKRTLRKLRHAAEDIVEDVEHQVKKRRLPAMTGAVVVGLGVGFLVGWVLAGKD